MSTGVMVFVILLKCAHDNDKINHYQKSGAILKGEGAEHTNGK
ncbi:MAG: hypothetical protein ACERKN_12700 [Velocimicrobium sp.]